jgi:hypothetical protein
MIAKDIRVVFSCIGLGKVKNTVGKVEEEKEKVRSYFWLSVRIQTKIDVEIKQGGQHKI